MQEAGRKLTDLFLGASASLAELQTLLSAMFECSPESIVVTDEQHRAVYLNPPMLKTMGDLGGNWLGQNGVEVYPDYPSMAALYEKIQSVFETKQSQSMFLYRPEDTHRRPLYDVINISPILDKNGDAVGTLSMGRDGLLERSYEMQALERRHQYQKALLDTFPFIVWMKDQNSRFITTNKLFAQIVGKENSWDLEGKTDFDFFPQAMAQGYVDDDRDVLNTGQAKTVGEKVLKSDGEIYWVETFKAPAYIEGQVIGTVGFARGVTLQKKLVTEIAKNRSEYMTLVENLPLGIVSYDLDCSRIFVNNYFEKLYEKSYGKMPTDLLGNTPEQTWSACDSNVSPEDYMTRLRTVMETGVEQSFEIHFIRNQISLVHAIKIVPKFNELHQIVGAIALTNDVTEINQFRQRIEHLAFHDPLTDLPNRALFNDRLQQAISNAKRHGLQLGVFLIDLDHFKTINDTLGHAVGDQLLVEAAQRLLKSVRSNDTIARMGGDEFAVLITDVAHMDDLSVSAAKIVQKMSSPFNIEGSELFVSASVGIASFPRDSEDIDDLMRYADSAMYHAKRRGRNNFQFYENELTSALTERVLIETALRHALEKNELELYYQPCVDLETGKLVGAEALLRWRSRELGEIGPDRFIPIAEESGQIVAIGSWVLMQACKTIVEINKHRTEPLKMAINLSTRQFLKQDLDKTISGCLQLTGCHPSWMTLEITESLILQDNVEIQRTLTAIHKLGINIAIDDFGTGYSALGYLRKFPVQQIKIDRSFVSEIVDDEDARYLVQAIIAMAKSMRLGLVAEGIETPEQAALLLAMGCKLAQGYLFGKPMPLLQYMAHLE